MSAFSDWFDNMTASKCRDGQYIKLEDAFQGGRESVLKQIPSEKQKEIAYEECKKLGDYSNVADGWHECFKWLKSRLMGDNE